MAAPVGLGEFSRLARSDGVFRMDAGTGKLQLGKTGFLGWIVGWFRTKPDPGTRAGQNMMAMNAFIRALRDDPNYGPHFADMATHQLTPLLQDGKPLSARMVRQMIRDFEHPGSGLVKDMNGQMAERFSQREVHGDPNCFSSVYADVCQDKHCDVRLSDQDLTELRSRIRDAISQAGQKNTHLVTLDEAKLIAKREIEQCVPYLKEGVPGPQVYQYIRMGVTPNEAHEFVATPGNFKAWTDLGFSGPEAVAYRKGGLKPTDAAPYKGHLLPAQMVSEYVRLKIPYSDKTKIGDFHDGNMVGVPKTLGSGQFNTVSKISYKRTDGSTFVGVFKEEQVGGGGGVAKKTGIGTDGKNRPINPQFGCRNIATYRLNRKLGFEVIPPTEFAMHDGKMGIVMGLAGGTSPIKDTVFEVTVDSPYAELLKYSRQLESDPALCKDAAEQLDLKRVWVENGKVMAEGQTAIRLDFTDPVLRRELTKLQLLDALTAQGDRHAGNYFVQLGPDGHVTKVTGIDNDQCLGRLVTDPNETRYAKDPDHKMFRGCRLPEVVDYDMMDAFMGLTDKDLEDELGGLVTPEELDAAKQRLAGIKTHLMELERTGRVIDAKDWGEELLVGPFLGNKETSYLARDERWYGRFQGEQLPVKEYDQVVK